MQPSETEHGQRWISNFDEGDQSAAKLLLDSLELVGQDELRKGLQGLARDLAKEIRTPIALVPVRELAAAQHYYGPDRNAKAPVLLPTSLPGSEAIIANIISGLRREDENSGPFIASPSLRNLRQARCRSIVFVDDFSGSGSRISQFFEIFRKHPTLRSWKSYKLIDFHFAVYAITRAAHERLSRIFGEENIHFVKMCPTFSSQKWTKGELLAVEKICKQYANFRIPAFGYSNSRALVAFSHSAPNNLPAVLWQRHSSRRDWNPFFIDKAVPEDLEPLFVEQTYELRLQAALNRLGQKRLVTGHWQNVASDELQNVLLVLAAIARKPRNLMMISEVTRLPYREISKIVENCKGWGLIGKNSLRLTDTGRSELEHAKTIALPNEDISLKGTTEFYYPSALRVGR